MARYTADSKDRVREAVDFVGLVSERTDLRRAGSQWMGLCPFHEERSPSFSLDPVKKVYNCFGCGERGDVFSFVQKTQGLDFVQALELLADRAHIELQREEEDPEAERRRAAQDRFRALLSRAAQFYSAYLWKAGEADGARTYLAERGLEQTVLEKFQVGYAPAAGDKLLQQAAKAGFSAQDLITAGLARRRDGRVEDAFRGRIIFPLADHRGRVLGFAGRALRPGDKPKYLNTSENRAVGFFKGQMLYGMHEARTAAMKNGRFVVVEGYTDVLGLHQAGVPECVAIMGTSLTDPQLEELTRVQGTVYLALDADNAGKNATSRASRMAAERGTELRIVAMPAGRDPAEIVTQDGPDAFRKLLDDAMNVWTFQLRRHFEQSQLTSAEGRDRAFAPAVEIIRSAPLLIRDALIVDVQNALGVDGAVVTNAVASAPEQVGAAGANRAPAPHGAQSGSASGPQFASAPAPSSGSASAPVRSLPPMRPNSQVERAERVFLSLCLGLGERGMEWLQRSTPEHFATDLMRRARTHLLRHTGDPLAGLSPDDNSLASAVMEIVQMADEGEMAEQELRLSYLQLDLRRLERDIRSAEQNSEFEHLRRLWGERESVRGEISELMGQTA